METFVIWSNEPIDATESIFAIQQMDASASLQGGWERSVLELVINSSLESKIMMEHHDNFVRYHRGNRVFWTDGGSAGNIEHRKFVGYGDGVTTDFLLPYRNIYPSSLVMSVNYSVTAAWTVLSETAGQIRFDSAPANEAPIYLEKVKHRLKCYIVIESNKLLNVTDSYKSFATRSIKIREFPW